VSAVELCLPADVQYVGLARLVVCAAARIAGMDSDRVEDLRIAVSEATTNAIMAHRRSGRPEPVMLRFGTDDQKRFQVTVVDSGPGFQPAAPEALNGRDWRDESGLGVTIIRGLADEVRFERGEGMQVSMRFALELQDLGAEDAAGDRGSQPV
jgi:serine/threonine-protein kinase RsbW